MLRYLAAAVVMMFAMPVGAATTYISDALTVPMRSGPSTGHRILHSGLPSGTALEVIDQDAAAGFTQVRLANGTEGWVPTQYLVNQPVAKDRLATAEKRIQALESELKTARENFQQARGARSEAETLSTNLGAQTRQLEKELADLRRVSANAVAYYDENNKLRTENQQLSSEVARLTQLTDSLKNNVQLRWLLFGGSLVIVGLIIGVMIKSRPKRRGFS